MIYHVVGTILQGMTFETKRGKQLEESESYVEGSKVLIGSITQTDLPRFETACRAVPPPPKQMQLNGKRLNPSKPLYRYGEWIDDVKGKVIAEGIVKP